LSSLGLCTTDLFLAPTDRD